MIAVARMLHERSPWAMLTSTTGEAAVEALDEVDSIRVHLEIYREEMHAWCALQTLTAWMLRPHAKRINIQFSSRGMEQSFDDGVHVALRRSAIIASVPMPHNTLRRTVRCMFGSTCVHLDSAGSGSAAPKQALWQHSMLSSVTSAAHLWQAVAASSSQHQRMISSARTNR